MDNTIQIEVPDEACDEFFTKVWAVGDMGFIISAERNLALIIDKETSIASGITIITVKAEDPIAFFALGSLTAELLSIHRKKAKIQDELKQIQKETSEKISQIIKNSKDETD